MIVQSEPIPTQESEVEIPSNQKCPICGAELARVRDHLSCTRFPFGHYFDTCGFAYSFEQPLPRGGAPSAKPHPKWAAWEKRHKGSWICVETLWETGLPARKAVLAPASKKPTSVPTAAPPRPAYAGVQKAASWPRKGTRSAISDVTDDEARKYLEYCALMQANHLQPRGLESWLEYYRAFRKK
jgi:hypothetical protein